MRWHDPFLVDKLLREKEGIFLWCLEGLHRLIGNNYQFSISGKARENMETVKRSSNNAIEFLQSEGYIRFKADSEASSKAIYEAYTRWCDDNAQKPKLRSRVMIFRYQLSHIRSGKSHIQKSLAVWKPELERYTGLVQQIKEKSKERKTLVAEKKALPIYHVKRHKALAVRIAELTEDLEELRSEKALLLQKFEYAEDAGAEAFRKDIATMEAGLKKLGEQEQKYSAELDKVLTEYSEMKAQTADFDPVELYEARQAIRPAQEKAAEKQLENTTQEKPSLVMLLSAKQETSRLLGEDAEDRQARQMVMQRQKEQRTVPQNQSKKKEHWER